MFRSMSDLSKHRETVTSKGLHTAIIYFYSPISEQVEERHIYADEYMECVEWLATVTARYQKNGFSFITYFNNQLRDVEGKLIFDSLNFGK